MERKVVERVNAALRQFEDVLITIRVRTLSREVAWWIMDLS